MPATSDELAYARSWIGELETDADFNERVDRLEAELGDHDQAVNAAIEESIRARITVLTLDQPSNMSIGGISIGWGANLQSAQKHLEDFMTGPGGSQTYGVTVIDRPDVR